MSDEVLQMITETHPQYKVVTDVNENEMEAKLNFQAKQGWMLHTIIRGAGSWTLILGPKNEEVVIVTRPEKKK